MRHVVWVLGLLCACSFGMKGVQPDWDGASEPECTSDQAPVILDAIAAGLSLGIGVAAGDESVAANDAGHPNRTADVMAISGFVLALGFTVSAIVGESTYKECKNAKAEWRLGGAIGAGVARGNREGAKPEHKPKVEATPAVAAPRGFFCSSSPSNAAVSFCVRDKAECERTRDVSLDALPDLATCALTESAWCFEGHCSTTKEACDGKRTRAIGGGETPEECDEER
jgi:hypothetical protein